MANLAIKDPPVFTEQIHMINKKDRITAELENEIKGALLNNDIFLKKFMEEISEKISNVQYRPLATRIRNPDKPDYGLGGGGEWSGTLEVASYSGTAEVTVVVNGAEYDGKNISQNGEAAPNGTIIIREE